MTSTVVTDLAGAVDATLLGWIAEHVDFATSMVDRITPGTTDEDRRLVAQAQGYEDASPVPTEPFAEWVISGSFPAGRPAWQDAGARLVEDITPYEQRKLWLLNASHSLLAYAGSIRGHATIDEAIADPQCRSWVGRVPVGWQWFGQTKLHLRAGEPLGRLDFVGDVDRLVER